MGRTSLLDSDNGSFFNQVVRDAVSDLKSNKVAYVFSSEQLQEVYNLIKKKNFGFSKEDINVREDGGFYYLTNLKSKNRKSGS